MNKAYIDFNDRQRHLYISGKSGFGKSALMHSLIYQDMRNCLPLCVIDAKNDLIPTLLHWVPSYRKDDVILISTKHPFPIDFMACDTETDQEYLISDMIEIFNRLSKGEMGNRMEGLLRLMVGSLALTENATLLDIYRLLTDESKRKEMLQNQRVMADPTLNMFWKEGIRSELNGEAAKALKTSVLSKVAIGKKWNTILGTPGGLRIDYAIRDRTIILVQLEPGQDQDKLLGSLVFSAIRQAIFKRQPHERTPYPVYIDEFQNFKSAGFEQVLEMGRSYGLWLTLANQAIEALEPSLQKALMNCVSNFVLFNMTRVNAGPMIDFLVDDSTAWKDRERELKAELKDVQKRLDHLCEKIGQNYTNWTKENDYQYEEGKQWMNAKISTVEDRKRQIEQELATIHPPVQYMNRLVNLKTFKAILRTAGITKRIRTPHWPPHTDAVGKTSWRSYIESRTAQLGTIRTPPLQNSEVLQTEGDAIEPEGLSTLSRKPGTESD